MIEPEPFSPLLAAILFPIGWFLIMHWISILGGWRRFAEVYASESEFAGTKKYFQSALLHHIPLLPASYSNMISIGANQSGVYFGVLILFRPGHEPFFIPFEELEGQERRFLFVFRYVTLRAQRTPEVAISVNQKLGIWLEEQSQGDWSFQRRSEMSQ